MGKGDHVQRSMYPPRQEESVKENSNIALHLLVRHVELEARSQTTVQKDPTLLKACSRQMEGRQQWSVAPLIQLPWKVHPQHTWTPTVGSKARERKEDSPLSNGKRQTRLQHGSTLTRTSSLSLSTHYMGRWNPSSTSLAISHTRSEGKYSEKSPADMLLSQGEWEEGRKKSIS